MLKLLRIEWEKLYRYAFFWYSFLVIIGLYVLLLQRLNNRFPVHYALWIEFGNRDPWQLLLFRLAINLSLAASLYLLGIVLMVIQVETQGNWKRLLTLPVSFFRILCGKLYLVLLVFLIVYSGLFLATLLLVKPILVKKHNLIFANEMFEEVNSKYLIWYLFTLLSFVKFIFFHLLLSIRLRENQFYAFLIGCIGMFLPFQNSFLPYRTSFDYRSDISDVLGVLGIAVLYAFTAIYFLKKESALRYFT